MKQFFLFALPFLTLSAQAQVTIANADMPVVDDTVRISTTIDQWGIDPTQTGPAYTWDFSFLTPQSQALDTFYAVTSVPFAYQFFFNNAVLYNSHKASYATRGQDIDLFGFVTISNVYNFYKNDGNKYKNVGFGANINGLPASVRNIPIDTVYNFPLTYNDTYTSYSEFEVNVPNTFYLKETKTVSSAVVDGYGSLITPLGTFQAIRVKFTIDITDSIYINQFSFGTQVSRPTETQYHWLAPEMKEPVLQINETAGNITTIRYQDVPSPLSVQEITQGNLSIYPNPAKEFFVIESPGVNGLIEIFDLSGRIVYTQQCNQNAEKIMVPVNQIERGNYIVRLSDTKQSWTSQLVIIH